MELVFDNSDHRAGGQWGQFTEIAVRRVLTRDGTSSYFINNQAVRRRDVQDVFLGTGLGPRAYAIIGQGTISRIIESKPEELRLFLEEAAGVSKYKERRRETENRLSDTRSNLTRVEDILRELNSSLEKLERQAEVAQKYQSMQTDVTLKQHQIWFLRRAEAQAEQVKVQRDAQASVNALESRMADVRRIEAELEQVRQAHYAAADEVNQSQGLLYEASAEVGRLEAEIRYVVENRQRVEQRLLMLQAQSTQWAERRAQALLDQDQLLVSRETGAEQAQLLDAQTQEQAQHLPALEEALQSAQAATVAQRDAVAQVQQALSVLASEQRNIQEQSRQLSARRERLGADRNALTQTDEVRLQDLQAQWEQARAVAEESLERLHSLQESAPELDEARRAQQQQVNTDAARYADLSARLEALKALQGLWTRIQVQAGWENAIEAALRDRLGALEVSKLEMVQAFIQDVPPVKLSFFNSPLAGRSGATSTLAALADKVQIHDAGLAAVVAEWLRGSYAAKDMDQAFAQRAQLQAGENLFVPQGHAVGAHSVSFYAADAEQAGLLARAQEIQNLEKDARAQAMMAEASRSALNRAESAYAQCAAQLVDVRRQAQESQTHSHSLEVEVLRLTQLAEQTRQRSSEIEADAAEVDAMLEDLSARSQEAEARFESLDLRLGESQEKHADLQERAMAAQAQLDQSREQLRSLERQVQEQMFNQRSLLARAQEIERSLQTADAQTVAVAEEVARGQAELQELSDVAAQAGLQSALSLKAEREQALGAKRSTYEDLTATLRSHEERRLQLERELDPMRQRITELQLKEQAARLGFEQYENQLFEAQADLDALAQSLEGHSIRMSALQAEIDRLHREIASLGAVNLAALDELTSSRERKEFLDVQSLDLNEAMRTLEDAIRKIDAETRELLAETFNEVNRHFGEMFPVLFGGGNARLVITGDEILDSGVQVIAQPPGKKNQTIHLLSGGEKALTAIALVFAIFQLNPAPFCLLDEVDAPLDDANTERYTKLVQRMSAGTQFLFISHNKIAMEMAEQLIGVTMQEQGVSRIVAVDMEVAVGLVEAA